MGVKACMMEIGSTQKAKINFKVRHNRSYREVEFIRLYRVCVMYAMSSVDKVQHMITMVPESRAKQRVED